jgi:hypothetical protein
VSSVLSSRDADCEVIDPIEVDIPLQGGAESVVGRRARSTPGLSW